MKITLSVDGTTYIIKLKGPTKEEMFTINSPDTPEQKTARDVWCDRKLDALKIALLNKKCTYKHD